MLRPFFRSSVHTSTRQFTGTNISIATKGNSRTFTTATTFKMGTVERITLFNIPKEEHRAQLVEEYKQLVKTAVKVIPFTLTLTP